METALLKRGEEVAPVDLRFAQSAADAQDGAAALRIDTDGHQHGAIEHDTPLADLFVAGVQDEVGIGDRVEAALAPEIELGIEQCGGAADLGGGDLQGAGEILEHLGDLAGGDALDVHLGDGLQESLLAAPPPFQDRGVEGDLAPDLGDGLLDGPQAGVEALGLEAVGMTLSGIGPLVRSGPEDGGSFHEHGVVEEDAEGLGEAAVGILKNVLHHLIEQGIVVWTGVGHFWACCCW